MLPIPEKSKRVIGLGLAPGVTNLAAAAYTKKEPSAQMIVIDVLLGIGDRHGEAAVRWTFEQLNRTYIHPKWAQPIENFVYSRKTDFGPPFGKRRSANFGFADQHLLFFCRSFTQLCNISRFGSKLVDCIVKNNKKVGLARLFKNPRVIKSPVWFMKRGLVGDRSFVVKVSNGQVKDPEKIVLFGEEEAKMTAEIAVFVANKILIETLPNGHYHLTELTTMSEILSQLPRLSATE